MKKLIITLTLTVIICSFFSFVPSNSYQFKSTIKAKGMAKTTEYVKYGFCVAREQAKSGAKNEPVVTNVFKFTCGTENYPKDYIILGQFNTFYVAYYKTSRNTMHIKDEIKFMYDTWGEAEKKRNETIAKYVNNGNNPLLIEKFSVQCED